MSAVNASINGYKRPTVYYIQKQQLISYYLFIATYAWFDFRNNHPNDLALQSGGQRIETVSGCDVIVPRVWIAKTKYRSDC